MAEKRATEAYLVEKNVFANALKQFIQSQFGDTVPISQFDEEKPPIIDPNDGTFVRITLKEQVV